MQAPTLGQIICNVCHCAARGPETIVSGRSAAILFAVLYAFWAANIVGFNGDVVRQVVRGAASGQIYTTGRLDLLGRSLFIVVKHDRNMGPTSTSDILGSSRTSWAICVVDGDVHDEFPEKSKVDEVRQQLRNCLDYMGEFLPRAPKEFHFVEILQRLQGLEIIQERRAESPPD
jgi:hypothetical protein